MNGTKRHSARRTSILCVSWKPFSGVFFSSNSYFRLFFRLLALFPVSIFIHPFLVCRCLTAHRTSNIIFDTLFFSLFLLGRIQLQAILVLELLLCIWLSIYFCMEYHLRRYTWSRVPMYHSPLNQYPVLEWKMCAMHREKDRLHDILLVVLCALASVRTHKAAAGTHAIAVSLQS